MTSPKQVLGSMALLLTVLCLSSSAQRLQTEGQAARNPIKHGPCSVLSTGGTVYNEAECEELASTGRLVQVNNEGRPTTVVLVAGATTRWQVVAKTKGKSLVGVPVKLTSKKDHSVVARAVTDREGKFSLSIPLTFQGDVDAQIDDGGFCFKRLEPEPVHLEIMCVDDVEFCFRIVHVVHP